VIRGSDQDTNRARKGRKLDRREGKVKAVRVQTKGADNITQKGEKGKGGNSRWN
jgi:hypothetical protein